MFKYPIGTVVRYKGTFMYHEKKFVDGRYGHVLGFEVVEYDTILDIVLLVRWADGETTKIHPSSVEVNI